MTRSERRRRTRAVKSRARQPWRQMSWPWATHGAKAGVSDIARGFTRAERVRVRTAIARGDEPEPYRTRGRAAYDLF